jgi:hypothetical protein
MRRFVFAAFALTVFAACQPATTELTEEQKAEIVSAASQLAANVLTGFDNEDPSVLDYYSRWLEYPSVGYPSLDEMPAAFQRSWWDRWENRRSEMGEITARVLGPDAVLVYHTDVSTATDTTGTNFQQRWIGRQLCVRENGEWKILFEGFDMLESREIP